MKSRNGDTKRLNGRDTIHNSARSPPAAPVPLFMENFKPTVRPSGGLLPLGCKPRKMRISRHCLAKSPKLTFLEAQREKTMVHMRPESQY